jgi:hypothetical protein
MAAAAVHELEPLSGTLTRPLLIFLRIYIFATEGR